MACLSVQDAGVGFEPETAEKLFDAFFTDPGLLPPDHQERAARDPARAIADYIAGMTDRYAMREHRRLFAVDDL